MIALHFVLLAVALVGFVRLRETDDVLEFIPPGALRNGSHSCAADSPYEAIRYLDREIG